MFGLTIDKFLVILVIALIILGPEKLPSYAQKLGELVKRVRRMTVSAKDRLREEMGEDFQDLDWKQLDPRQYDPRRIILEAIEEDRAAERAAEQRQQRQQRMAETARQRYRPQRDTGGGSTPEPLSGAAIATQAFANHRSNSVEARVGFHYDTEAT